MTIRLLISDIDGTFVRSDKSVGDPVLAACARLRAAGVQLALISARPASGMLWIADKLALDGAIGAFNGGTIVRRNGTPDGEVLSAERLDPAVAERALAAIDRPGVIRWLFHKGRWHTTALDDYYTAKERKTTSQEPVVVGSFAGLTDAVDKIVAVSGAAAMLGDLERAVAGELGAGANVIRSQTYYLDVTAPRANKGDGVAALARAYGVDLADVAVIGDQRNDMAMFARAGLSIAMGQAPDEVKAAAHHVTASNDRDGVAQAIDEIVLPLVRAG